MSDANQPKLRQATPPHHPTHNVHLSEGELERIISEVFPGVSSHSAQQAPQGTFFNNRIYFIAVDHPLARDYIGSGPGTDGERVEFVIKVMGQYWGAEKVQNETACLWLLEKHCPTIPSPTVVAWSDDGRTVTVVSPDRTKLRRSTLQMPQYESDAEYRSLGWIMTTRLPGRPVSDFELSPEEKIAVGKEVARIATTWRTSIPAADYCGNVRIQFDEKDPSKEEVLSDRTDTPGSNLTVLGLLPDGHHVKNQCPTSLDYFRARLGEKLAQLETDPVYAPNLDISKPVRDLLSTDLPKLPVAQQKGRFVFTHYDLSPRNVLATRAAERGGELIISGIVDFEFAGFFPPLEEFVNDYVENSGDWPDRTYRAYLESLAERGIPTPDRGCDGQLWRQAYLLGVLENNIAPWQLCGGLPSQESRRLLAEARNEVRNALDELLVMEKREI